MPYVADPFAPARRRTRVVHVGDVPVGGEHPIVLKKEDEAGAPGGAPADYLLPLVELPDLVDAVV